MDESVFYKENCVEETQREVVLDKDSGKTWLIRPMSFLEAEEIRKSVGADSERYESLLLARSVTEPDLKNVALQQQCHTVGEEETLLALLSAGQYETLKEAVEVFNS